MPRSPRGRHEQDDDDDDGWSPDEDEAGAGYEGDYDQYENVTVPCPYCSEEIPEDTPRCPYCENYISEEDGPPARKPLWIVIGALLALVGLLYCTKLIAPFLR